MLEVRLSPQEDPLPTLSPQLSIHLTAETLALCLEDHRPTIEAVARANSLREDLNRLEAEKDRVVGQVMELRQLLCRIAKEVQKDRELRSRFTSELKLKRSRLAKALAVAEVSTLHFEEVSAYWLDNCRAD